MHDPYNKEGSLIVENDRILFRIVAIVWGGRKEEEIQEYSSQW